MCHRLVHWRASACRKVGFSMAETGAGPAMDSLVANTSLSVDTHSSSGFPSRHIPLHVVKVASSAVWSVMTTTGATGGTKAVFVVDAGSPEFTTRDVASSGTSRGHALSVADGAIFPVRWRASTFTLAARSAANFGFCAFGFFGVDFFLPSVLACFDFRFLAAGGLCFVPAPAVSGTIRSGVSVTVSG